MFCGIIMHNYLQFEIQICPCVLDLAFSQSFSLHLGPLGDLGLAMVYSLGSRFCLRTSKTLSLGRFDASHSYLHFTSLAPCFWPKIPKFICILGLECLDSSYLSTFVLISGILGFWSHLDAIWSKLALELVSAARRTFLRGRRAARSSFCLGRPRLFK